MKKRFFLPIMLVLIVGLGFIFSACSDDSADLKFDLDENGTVNLTYTCNDSEKDFVAELNAEQSRNLIFALNKITYVEVKEHLDFNPSYDCLKITVGNDNLDLYDVWYMINYGGYFYFNGKFYQTNDKFEFLASYMNEYCPDNFSSNVPFDVQYVKSAAGAQENYRIIKSVSQLNDYIATEIQKIDLPNNTLFMNGAVSKYDDEYFENSFIVVFMTAVTSGSFDFRVSNVYINGDRLIVRYDIFLPNDYEGEIVGVTCDMAYWYSFIQLSNEYNTIQNVDLIPID